MYHIPKKAKIIQRAKGYLGAGLNHNDKTKHTRRWECWNLIWCFSLRMVKKIEANQLVKFTSSSLCQSKMKRKDERSEVWFLHENKTQWYLEVQSTSLVRRDWRSWKAKSTSKTEHILSLWWIVWLTFEKEIQQGQLSPNIEITFCVTFISRVFFSVLQVFAWILTERMYLKLFGGRDFRNYSEVNENILALINWIKYVQLE